jgi:hypothetical protein
MKKEYQYLCFGVVLAGAVLLGMGVVAEQKQVSDGRYQFIPYTDISYLTLSGSSESPVCGMFDTQTGTFNFVSRSQLTVVFPFVPDAAR